MNLEGKIVSQQIRAMDDTQKKITVKNLPSQMLLDEIERRNAAAKDVLTNVRDILYGKNANMPLVEMEKTINELREALSLKKSKAEIKPIEKSEAVKELESVVGDTNDEEPVEEKGA